MSLNKEDKSIHKSKNDNEWHTDNAESIFRGLALGVPPDEELNPSLISGVLKEDNVRKEREQPISRKHETLRETLNQLIEDIRCLPAEEQLEQIQEVIACSLAFKESIERPVPHLPDPDLTGNSYPIFKKGQSIHPYDWLKENWGAWLKHFNKELDHNYLYLDQLGKLDPALKGALYSRCMSIRKRTGCEISEIVPKKSARIDLQLEQIDQAELQKSVNLAYVPKMRKFRAT